MSDTDVPTKRHWPDYRAVWRWHFYASLFCMPFVIILSITGAIYLFKPQIDRWEDSAYDNLKIDGSKAPISEQIRAAIALEPNAIPIAYELPIEPSDASRILIQGEGQTTRVFVHPVTLEVLGSRPDGGGFIRQVRSFHGQLGIGERGSNIVELAASWTMIMILTGLYLWWPRSAKGLAGVLYPRLSKGPKLFWRDIHSVTAIWISVFVIFLIATGLPWAKFWGGYFRNVRALAGLSVTTQDWTVGGAQPIEGGNHENHTASKPANKNQGIKAGAERRGRKRSFEIPNDLTCFDRVAAAVTPLGLAHPATIEPPSKGSSEWIAKSDAQNRTLRVTLKVNGDSGEIVSRDDFSTRHIVDRIISMGIAAHEGQLFGIANQLLGLVTAMGLILLSISGYVMWWRRREPGSLGAPRVMLNPQVSYGLIAIIVAMGVYLPLFGASLLLVIFLEWLVLSRISSVRRWLGLRNRGTIVNV